MSTQLKDCLLRLLSVELRLVIFEHAATDSVIDEYDLPNLLRTIDVGLYCEALPFFKEAFKVQNYTVTMQKEAEFLAKSGPEKQIIKNLTIIDLAPIDLGNSDPPSLSLRANPVKLRNNIVELKLEYLPRARPDSYIPSYPTEIIRASQGKCRKFTMVLPYTQPGCQRDGQENMIRRVNGNLGISGVLSATRNGWICIWTINTPLRSI